MALISEDVQYKKLKAKLINIKTKYIVGNTILERNTDNSKNDDIKDGIRCKKEYYINNILKHTESSFDSRITYTYISKENEESIYKCPNCLYEAKVKEFTDSCPYCRTKYNIDYTNKNLGSKYHYDRVLRSNKYKIITAIIDILVSLLISYIFIKNTSRTFNNIDIAKIFVYGGILSLILYYFFYIADAYVVLEPIKRYKDQKNQEQIEFWNRTKIDKKTFFNNFNYEVRNFYYKKDNIIDYDIIDIDDYKETDTKEGLKVKVDAYVRIVYVNGNKIKSEYKVDSFTMKKVHTNIVELKEGTNLIKCPTCGASIDVTKGYCEYCKNKAVNYQEWEIEK